MRRRGDQRERGRGGADQSAHAAKGTLGRVNPRLLLAFFLVGLFAIGAAAYAIVEGDDERPTWRTRASPARGCRMASGRPLSS